MEDDFLWKQPFDENDRKINFNWRQLLKEDCSQRNFMTLLCHIPPLRSFLWCGLAPPCGFVGVCFVCPKKCQAPSRQGKRLSFGILTVLTNIISTMVLWNGIGIRHSYIERSVLSPCVLGVRPLSDQCVQTMVKTSTFSKYFVESGTMHTHGSLMNHSFQRRKTTNECKKR